jgi:N-acetylmuramic acid 6-phosphate etherase
MTRVTEQSSKYNNLDKMSTNDLLVNMNNEDKTVPYAVEKCIPNIEKLVDGIVERMKKGGRLFYLGAGTSGRLGILDASEIPPTFGAPYDLVIGLIAGGDSAIRKAVEAAEDSWEGGWNDVMEYDVSENDVLVGIGAVKEARSRGILTGCVTCNPDSPLSKEVEIPIEAVVGPEFVTGSTRMKAGTAQKLVLNMITTTSMIKLGRVKGNKMVDMQLTNAKLVDRGTRMIMDEASISDYEQAKELLMTHGSVRKAVDFYLKSR